MTDKCWYQHLGNCRGLVDDWVVGASAGPEHAYLVCSHHARVCGRLAAASRRACSFARARASEASMGSTRPRQEAETRKRVDAGEIQACFRLGKDGCLGEATAAFVLRGPNGTGVGAPMCVARASCAACLEAKRGQVEKAVQFNMLVGGLELLLAYEVMES